MTGKQLLLGNMGVGDIERRGQVRLSDDDREFMESTRQQNAKNVAHNEWHCFDMPFTILCGSREMATDIYNCLKKYDFKTRMSIGIRGE